MHTVWLRRLGRMQHEFVRVEEAAQQSVVSHVTPHCSGWQSTAGAAKRADPIYKDVNEAQLMFVVRVEQWAQVR